MNKLTLLVVLVVLVVLAIMFDWFGARDVVESGVDSAQNAVEKIQDTGDRVSDAVETFKEDKKVAQ